MFLTSSPCPLAILIWYFPDCEREGFLIVYVTFSSPITTSTSFSGNGFPSFMSLASICVCLVPSTVTKFNVSVTIIYYTIEYIKIIKVMQ